MTDQTRGTLDRLMGDVPIGPAPIDALLIAGRRAKHRRRRALIGGVAVATALVLGGGALTTQALTRTDGGDDVAVATAPQRTPTDGATGNPQPPLRGFEGTWTVKALVSEDGTSALSNAYRGKAQLTFDDGNVQGTTGCNDLSGTYQHDGDDFRFPGDLLATVVGCRNEPPLVERLQDVRHISQDQDAASLTLHTENWMIVAVLEPRNEGESTTDGPESGTNADLFGETWRPLPRYVPQLGSFENSPRTGEVTFMPGGRWTGFDGCNRASGAYALTADGLTMTGGALTDVGCANMSPEGYLNGTVVTVSASGTHLTATNAKGEVVVEYAR